MDRKPVSIAALLPVIAFTFSTATAYCPRGWIHYGSSCYFFATEVESWISAEISCRAHNSKLAEVKNQGQLDFFRGVLKMNNYHGSRWIGGRRDEIQTDLWRWASTDEVIRNNLWDLGQPDNTYHKENCLELFESANWQWNDSQCSDESAYICEKPALNDPTTTQAVTQPRTTQTLPKTIQAVTQPQTTHINNAQPAIPDIFG